MPPFIIAFPVTNIVGLSQANSQTGLNLARGSLGAVQTLAQVAGNSAVITQR